jgi:hypothetical protein
LSRAIQAAQHQEKRRTGKEKKIPVQRSIQVIKEEETARKALISQERIQEAQKIAQALLKSRAAQQPQKDIQAAQPDDPDDSDVLYIHGDEFHRTSKSSNSFGHSHITV